MLVIIDFLDHFYPEMISCLLNLSNKKLFCGSKFAYKAPCINKSLTLSQFLDKITNHIFYKKCDTWQLIELYSKSSNKILKISKKVPLRISIQNTPQVSVFWCSPCGIKVRRGEGKNVKRCSQLHAGKFSRKIYYSINLF